MKRIIIGIIIILFLVPFFSRFIRYFKESTSQEKKITSGRQQLRDTPKAHVIPTRLKGSRQAGAPKERMKATGKSYIEKTADVAKKVTEEVKPKEQKGGSNIHDEILTYRLNSEDHIKQIQIALKKAGFYKSEIDGKMGPRTRRAIKEFQKAKKLNPDGVVGPKTWEALS